MAVQASAASFPDGPAPAVGQNSAIDDLLGLESEITAIQAGIQQIDKIAPSPPMSFQTDSMLPLNLSAPPPTQPAPPHQQVTIYLKKTKTTACVILYFRTSQQRILLADLSVVGK